MIKFFKGLKRAADFFSVNPDGLSVLTEKRFKDIETSVSSLPKSSTTTIMDWESFEPVYESLTHSLGEMNINIHYLLRKLDDKQEHALTWPALPVEQVKIKTNPRALKLKPVGEEVKKVKSTLTQAQVKRLFEYRDGELYWKTNRDRVKKGDLAGTIGTSNGFSYRKVKINHKTYQMSRVIFLMFYGYLPECVTYKDKDTLNTRIENLVAASHSQRSCRSRKRNNNSSGYKGVVFHQKLGKYISQISKQSKHYYLGLFDTPEEAYKAYCKAAKKLHGEFAQVA